MTKSLSIMLFPNYQDESSVVRSRERERERDVLERPADTGAALMSVSFGENSLSFLSILSRFERCVVSLSSQEGPLWLFSWFETSAKSRVQTLTKLSPLCDEYEEKHIQSSIK